MRKLSSVLLGAPTKEDNIKVVESKCGDCRICMKHYPECGFEMRDGKAKYAPSRTLL